MIHINKGKNAPHEWITAEEFQKRYPELAKTLAEPRPFNEHGNKLKAIRMKRRLTIHELSKRTGFTSSEISRIESGNLEITSEINDRYCLGLN
jgi:DNA-binding Xre family transcriptional regulator